MTITFTINLWYVLYFLLSVTAVYLFIGFGIGAAFFVATAGHIGFKETVKEINWKYFLYSLLFWPVYR